MSNHRISRELKALWESDKELPFDISPSGHDIGTLGATLNGPEGTPYEDGVFS
jgi:ubiquitin-protein ligase